MRFLTFSKERDARTGLPAPFESHFRVRSELVAEGGIASAEAFLSLRLPLAETPLAVSFSFDDAQPQALGLEQIHSGLLWEAGSFDGKPMGDGLFHAGKIQSFPLLSIRTADCLAIALSARVDEELFGALVHAGWRGYCDGIHLKALDALALAAAKRGISREALLSRMAVFVSPAIFGETYECGNDVSAALEGHRRERLSSLPAFAELQGVWSACTSVRDGEPGRIYPDFQLLACCDLVATGLAEDRIQVLRENTWGSPFLFSYRQACREGRERGRRLVTHLGP